MQQENELYVVYKHTNTINGKMYVGQTCQELDARWGKNGKGYEKYWVDESGTIHLGHFWASICKYGWNNFEHKVLIHGLTKSQADFWEKKLIKEWDLMNPQKGYNKKEGGSNGKFSDEIINKRTKTVLSRGIYRGENNPMYGSHRIGVDNPMYGKNHSLETRQKISETRKEKIANGEIKIWSKGKKCPQLSGKNNPRATKVVRLSDNKIYDLKLDCVKDNNLSKNTITKHCKNNYKTKPQEFMYYEDWLKQQKDEQ